MGTSIQNSAKLSSKHWVLSFAIGIFFVILGFWCLFTPFSTFLSLSYIFMIALLVGGVFEIIFALSNMKNLNGWGWTLIGGVLDVLIGISLIAMPPAASIFTLLFFLSFWILFRSLVGISIAIRLKKNNDTGWGFILLLSILGILCAFIIFLNPSFASSFIVVIFSIAVIMYGVQRIYSSLRQ